MNGVLTVLFFRTLANVEAFKITEHCLCLKDH